MAQSFENIRIVIADSSSMIRIGLKSALLPIGFRTITDTSSYARLHDLIADDAVDLIITSSELEGNDTGFLISEMRNQNLGPNPFVTVISLLASADPTYVRNVINTGADDLLLTPVSPDQLIMRIQKLIRARKPFVVTHDYTGPDRRSKPRSFESQSAPMLEVPNPLKLRLEHGLDGTRLQRMVAESGVTLNRMKIERYAVQLDWLSTHLHASIRDGVADTTTLLPYTNKFVQVAKDMIRRMRGTPNEMHIQSVEELLEIGIRLDAELLKTPFSLLERAAVIAKALTRSIVNPHSPMASQAAAKMA